MSTNEHYLKGVVRQEIANMVAKHENALYREIEHYYGAIHMSQTNSRVYKSGIDKIFRALFRQVAKEYYDFGGRGY